MWTTGANDDGEVKTITINADGTFRYVETTPDNPDGYVLTAKWTLDVGNYFLNLTDPTETNGEIIMADRIAFAPTDKSPAEIAVSFYWSETKTDENEDFGRHGDYYLRFNRQPAAQQ